jgi:hypothetical protein
MSRGRTVPKLVAVVSITFPLASRNLGAGLNGPAFVPVSKIRAVDVRIGVLVAKVNYTSSDADRLADRTFDLAPASPPARLIHQRDEGAGV